MGFLEQYNVSMPLEVGRVLQPYYAVMVFDGDRMGALLREMQGASQHHALSSALARFAAQVVPSITDGIDTNGDSFVGRLIYAGGDDVLAAFPITTVLPAATKLLTDYHSTLVKAQGLEQVKFYDKNYPLATASCGIVIAHHLTPLDFVLAEGRRAEEAAKEHYGRSAVAVRILRRSGEHTTAGYQFSFAADRATPVGYNELEVISTLAGYLASDQLSSRFVYDFTREAYALITVEMATSELRRLLYRHNSFERTAEAARIDVLLNGKLDDNGQRTSTGLTAMYAQIAKSRVQLLLAQRSGADSSTRTSLTDQILALPLLEANTVVELLQHSTGLEKLKREKLAKDLATVNVVASRELAGWLGVAEFIARGGTEE